MKIRQVLTNEKDLKMLQEHCDLHQAESGTSGNLIFTPLIGSEEQEPWDEYFSRKKRELETPITKPGWTRNWILTDEEKAYGDLTLCNSPPLEGCLHRCLLMMGLQKDYRGKGHGRAIAGQAIKWFLDQENLEWMDLNVFSHNLGAIKLYKSFGFQEIGRTNDRFRVQGQEINDIHMTLKK